jgi:UDP-N-acetylmuramate--alanine ligase
MDLNKIKHIHFTGIKGVAMTNLALCMKDMGKKITGSDVAELFVTDAVLKKNNIAWSVGFGEANLKPAPDLLVTTAAHGGFLNPEVKIAKENKIPVMAYAELMSYLANTKKVISVCGVGGKTTTSSMMSVLLDSAKLDPSYVIGVAKIFPLGKAGRFEKKGKYFVCEADDYVVSPGVDDRPKFMLLDPFVTVVTNIEYDHPDAFDDFEDTKIAFMEFFEKIPKDGLLIACADNPNVLEVTKKLKNVSVKTYGFNKDSDYRVKDVRYGNEETMFEIFNKSEDITYSDIKVKVPGEFNVRNATAAFIAGRFIGLEDDVIKKGLAKYLGCRRRFEKMGMFKEALFYDDYAHHPSEIKAILKAAREWYPKRRLIAIFQPHTFSRTKALYKEFIKSFKNTDLVGFMDIYPSARESFDATVSSEALASETAKLQKDVFYLGKHESALEWIEKNIKKGDLVITLGAGDIFHLYNSLKL